MSAPGMRFEVEAPAITPWRYGLLSASQQLTIPDSDNEHWQNGVYYESDACYQAGAWMGTPCAPPPATDRTITVTFTAAPDGGDTDVSAQAVVDTGAARQVLIDSTAETGGAVVPITTGAAAAVVYTQSPSAGATLAFTVTDVLTGISAVHNVTVSAAGAVTGGGTFELDVSDPVVKTYRPDENTIITGDPFTVYAEMSCRPTGMIATAEARARARLIAGEQTAVERVALTTVIAPGAADVTGNPAGVPLKQGLGTLEAYAASVYAGQAVFHAPRWLAPYISNIMYMYRDSSVLRTPLDTLWAFGGGYTPNITPAGAETAAGKVWVYATGQPVIRRSEIFVPAASVAQGGVNVVQNRMRIQAERTYVITVDCLRAAVQIDLTGEG